MRFSPFHPFYLKLARVHTGLEMGDEDRGRAGGRQGPAMPRSQALGPGWGTKGTSHGKWYGLTRGGSPGQASNKAA